MATVPGERSPAELSLRATVTFRPGHSQATFQLSTASLNGSPGQGSVATVETALGLITQKILVEISGSGRSRPLCFLCCLHVTV